MSFRTVFVRSVRISGLIITLSWIPHENRKYGITNPLIRSPFDLLNLPRRTIQVLYCHTKFPRSQIRCFQVKKTHGGPNLMARNHPRAMDSNGRPDLPGIFGVTWIYMGWTSPSNHHQRDNLFFLLFSSILSKFKVKYYYSLLWMKICWEDHRDFL